VPNKCVQCTIVIMDFLSVVLEHSRTLLETAELLEEHADDKIGELYRVGEFIIDLGLEARLKPILSCLTRAEKLGVTAAPHPVHLVELDDTGFAMLILQVSGLVGELRRCPGFSRNVPPKARRTFATEMLRLLGANILLPPMLDYGQLFLHPDGRLIALDWSWAHSPDEKERTEAQQALNEQLAAAQD
jgi:hypothetical protein